MLVPIDPRLAAKLLFAYLPIGDGASKCAGQGWPDADLNKCRFYRSTVFEKAEEGNAGNTGRSKFQNFMHVRDPVKILSLGKEVATGTVQADWEQVDR